MSVEGARMRMLGAMKDLHMKWGEAESLWRDATAEAFRRRYIESLEDAVRSAMPALEKMADSLARMRADCGDPR